MIEIKRRSSVKLTSLPDSISPLLKRIYTYRGIQDAEQLEKTIKKLHSYQKLDGIEQASELFFNRIK